jgi:hypothetical protein
VTLPDKKAAAAALSPDALRHVRVPQKGHQGRRRAGHELACAWAGVGSPETCDKAMRIQETCGAQHSQRHVTTRGCACACHRQAHTATSSCGQRGVALDRQLRVGLSSLFMTRASIKACRRHRWSISAYAQELQDDTCLWKRSQSHLTAVSSRNAASSIGGILRSDSLLTPAWSHSRS